VSVTFPLGFTAAGMSAGLKPSGRPDLGLLVGQPGTTVAGMFTTNRVAAAPSTSLEHRSRRATAGPSS
jgi:glutamate N-acetyltransferase/amino-acid N-acetyltransferase